MRCPTPAAEGVAQTESVLDVEAQIKDNPRRMPVNEFLSQSSLFPGLRAERLWSRSGETKRVECPLLLSGLQALTQLFRFRSLIKNEKKCSLNNLNSDFSGSDSDP